MDYQEAQKLINGTVYFYHADPESAKRVHLKKGKIIRLFPKEGGYAYVATDEYVYLLPVAELYLTLEELGTALPPEFVQAKSDR